MLSFLDECFCVGCGACYSVCPVKCISMKMNNEGFLYPVATEKCIKCGKCEKVCPQLSHNYSLQEKELEQCAYAAKSNEYDVWRKSSSGGAFAAICKAWDKDGDALIVGAAWDNLNVRHVGVQGAENISLFHGSKYIASELNECYSAIKQYLSSGKKVLFSGTPCQVAGLKSFLGKEYNNLLLVDIICHGVGSQKVFAQNIRFLEKYFNDKVIDYQFRFKSKYYEQDHIEKIKLRSGKEILLDSDPYLELFKKQLCLRKSCGENCLYRTRHRQGDITIGDFKGFTKVFPQRKTTDYNWSTIVINSDKGKSLIDDIARYMEMMPCNISDIEKYNPLFSSHTWFNQDRDCFFSEFRDMPTEAITKWGGPIVFHKKSIKRKIYEMLPRKFVSKLR